jgi:hypothetical protein
MRIGAATRRAARLVAIGALALLAVPAMASASTVTDWNQLLMQVETASNTGGPPGARDAAIVQIAVFDAVNGIHPKYAAIHVPPGAPHGASAGAAAASAAHEAMLALFPAQQQMLDVQLANSLAMLTDDQQSIDDGLAWGASVADQVLAWRATDGNNTVLPPYVAGSDPGDWQPTAPAFAATPAFRTFAVTTPFGMTSPSQFRPAGPPALDSAAYAAAFNEEAAIGSLTSSTRTAAQTLTARFWASDSPTALWNRVALRLVARRHMSMVGEARVLALMNAAAADGAIAVWDAKTHFDTWRPITAIQHADTDGNSDTAVDPTWQPLLTTPAFQEYPSGHVGVSSSSAYTLQMLFGRHAITMTSVAYPGMVRRYPSFSSAIGDLADARVFSGIHFRFSGVDAARMGRKIAHQDVHALATRSHRHH